MSEKEKVIKEIISTEKLYIEKLSTVIEVFLLPLRESNILESSEIQLQFGSWEMIYGIHKEMYEKMNTATTEAADLIRNSYSTAVKGVQDYNNKIIEFTQANTNAEFVFVQKMSGVKSPTAFIELWTEHARKQVETLAEQSKQLVALTQKVTRATAEPLKTGVANPFKIAA